MTTIVVHPAERPLAGSVPVPSDARVGHVALILAAVAAGESCVRGLARGQEAAWTAGCLRALGVDLGQPGEAELRVRGGGLGGLRAAAGSLDCGPSEETLRLLCGLLAAQPFRSTLTGQASLARTSIAAITGPLHARGAVLGGDDLPLSLGPLPESRRLTALEVDSPLPAAGVKGALLLSGLYADGPTTFREPTVSADHVERLLGVLEAPVRTLGPLVQLDPGGWRAELPAFDLTLPGDVSAASFVLAAGLLVPGSRVTTRAVGVNPTRAGWLEIARDMGAALVVESLGEHVGEPLATIYASHAPLRAIAFGGETLARAPDDLPAACALAARAAGATRVELPPGQEVPSPLVAALRAFGVGCEPGHRTLAIEGRGAPLEPADITSGGDPMLAMAAAVLALVARGPCRIRDAACITLRYPKFVATLRGLGARVEVEAET